MSSKYVNLSEDELDEKDVSTEQEVAHYGGCHCGAVRFKVMAPACVDVVHCR